jgi:hypothetical protein
MMKGKKWGNLSITMISIILLTLFLVIMTWWGSYMYEQDPFTYTKYPTPNDGYNEKHGMMNDHGQSSIINVKYPGKDDHGNLIRPGRITFGLLDGGMDAEIKNQRIITTNIQLDPGRMSVVDKNGNQIATTETKMNFIHNGDANDGMELTMTNDDVYKQIMLDPAFNTRKTLFPFTPTKSSTTTTIPQKQPTKI